MKILHISTRLIVGGSQENTILSCEGQCARGHEVHLAYGPIYGPEGSMLERVEAWNEAGGDAATERRSDELGGAASSPAPAWAAAHADVASEAVCSRRTGSRAGRGVIHTHVVPALVRPVHPWKDLRCYLQLRGLIARLAPDVVHTHSSKAGIVGRAAAWAVYRASRRRSNLGGHPPEGVAADRGAAPWHTGHGPGPAIVHTIHGPPFHRHEAAVRNRLYIASERFAARRCHRIVSVADAMTRQFLDAGVGRAERYTTVRSGIDVGAFERATRPAVRDRVRSALGFGGLSFVIGTVARLADLKGHDDILEALAPDLRARPDVKLLWVGDGWRRAELEARVRDLGLEGRVVLTGLAPPERVPALIGAMDLLVHASYREGLPRAVVQAMAAGVPVVASDVDGTSEVVEDLVTGRLFPAGSASALRDAVRWMLADESRRAAFGASGRERVRRAFSAARMVEDLEVVYEEARRCAAE